MKVDIYEDLVKDCAPVTWGHIESLLKDLPRVNTGHIYRTSDKRLILDTESISIRANVSKDVDDELLLGALEWAMNVHLDPDKILVVRAGPRISLGMDHEKGEARKYLYARFLQAPKE